MTGTKARWNRRTGHSIAVKVEIRPIKFRSTRRREREGGAGRGRIAEYEIKLPGCIEKKAVIERL